MCPAHAAHYYEPQCDERSIIVRDEEGKAKLPRRRRDVAHVFTHSPHVKHYGSMEILLGGNNGGQRLMPIKQAPDPNTSQISNVVFAIPESSVVNGFVEKAAGEFLAEEIEADALDSLADLACFLSEHFSMANKSSVGIETERE